MDTMNLSKSSHAQSLTFFVHSLVTIFPDVPQNVDMMLQCDECDSWRLLYSHNKLSRKERKDLEDVLAEDSFSCGAPVQDLDLPGKLAHMYVQELSCGDPVEKLYYTAKYPPFVFTVPLPWR